MKQTPHPSHKIGSTWKVEEIASNLHALSQTPHWVHNSGLITATLVCYLKLCMMRLKDSKKAGNLEPRNIRAKEDYFCCISVRHSQVNQLYRLVMARI